MYRQTSRLPGRIERLFIRNAGEQIVAGQPIASIYSRELIAVVEAYAYNNTSESVLRSAKNNLAAWGLPEEQVKEMLHRDDYRVPVDITADFSGTVLEVLVREGDHAANTHMGAPTVLFEVADLSKVWAIADIRVPDLDHISIGSRIQFQASGHSENQFSASIDWISPVVDSETGILKVRATIPNRYGHLKPGMEFSGHILASSKAEGFKVPASAVLWTGKHSFVYVKGNEFSGGDFYSIREIELGRKLNDDFYFVTDGLELGDEVVVNGAFQIDAQAQLSGKPSMMMPQQGRREETPHLEERELANDLRSHQTAR